MSTVQGADPSLDDRLRRLVDHVAEKGDDAGLDPELVQLARQLRRDLDRTAHRAAVDALLACYDAVTAGRASIMGDEMYELGSDGIAHALLAAPDVSAVVLEAMLRLDGRSPRRQAAVEEPVVPAALRAPKGSSAARRVSYDDAQALYRDVLDAGPAGVQMRTLGRELDDRRRAAALRRLRNSGAVVESREPNPDGHPAFFVRLIADERLAAADAA